MPSLQTRCPVLPQFPEASWQPTALHRHMERCGDRSVGTHFGGTVMALPVLVSLGVHEAGPWLGAWVTWDVDKVSWAG